MKASKMFQTAAVLLVEQMMVEQMSHEQVKTTALDYAALLANLYNKPMDDCVTYLRKLTSQEYKRQTGEAV